MQVSFFTSAAEPVTVINWTTETGAIVVVPACIAAIWQIPALRRLSEFPVTEQIVVVFDWKLTGPPLEATAVKTNLVLESLAVAGGEKLRDCEDRVIWNVRGKTSEAK